MAIVGFKERTVGREEGKDGVLYICHLARRFDGRQQVLLLYIVVVDVCVQYAVLLLT